MFVVESYGLAVVMCVITMLCWGSWANTQKLASKEWRFQLYYWDYAIGVILLALVLAFTLGSLGGGGRSFIEDVRQATASSLLLAFLGGVVFNFANILLVAAIDIAGMAVAFPIGIGLALVIGVVTNYIATPVGDPVFLFVGVAAIAGAIVLNAIAYRRLPSQGQKTTTKGIAISIAAGIPMGLFYYLVAASMSEKHAVLEGGKLGPYSAVVLFSLGLFVSNFLWNSIVMAKPFTGEPVPFGDYFKKGNMRLHSIGILGGVIWSIGMSFSILASAEAGFAISYGLGQGATMVAALWGVFIWREFKAALPSTERMGWKQRLRVLLLEGTGRLLTLMFVCYAAGLALIIYSRIA
ncbi:MAG: multidrug DMT transporter permease [Planctomycetes bacterium]|nr:multidrug DMT transporter permease [Planctomycetota bacterium]